MDTAPPEIDFNRLTTPILVIDQKGVIKRVNLNPKNPFGIDPADLVDHPAAEILNKYVDRPDTRGFFREVFRAARSFENHAEIEEHPTVKITDGNGRIRWLELSPVFQFSNGEKKEKTGFNIEVRDITETVRAKALNEASLLLNQNLSLDEFIPKIQQILGAIIPYDRANVILMHDETWFLESAWMTNKDGGISDESIPSVEINVKGKPLLVDMMESKTPLFVNDTFIEERYVSGSESKRGSWIGAPIIINGEVIGFLNLNSDKTKVYLDEDAKLLAAFSSHLALALKNSREHQKMTALARHDELTGLRNRRFFNRAGEAEFERKKLTGSELSALMIDVDLFKRINDTFGHPVGNTVLQAVAGRCFNSLRSIDILARWGGDEFAALITDSDIFNAFQAASRILHQVGDDPIDIKKSRKIQHTLSIGLADTSNQGNDDSFEKLMDRADIAVYAVKATGQNGIGIYFSNSENPENEQIAVYRPKGKDWHVEIRSE